LKNGQDFTEILHQYLGDDILSDIIKYTELNEIRLRADCPVAFTAAGKNHLSSVVLTQNDLHNILVRLCGNSLHSYMDKICEGYIPFVNGWRVGVCGSAVYENGRLIGITDITSINIRIPRYIANISGDIIRHLADSDYKKGILLFSQPGTGKTTLLKDITKKLSSYPLYKKVSLIDSRCEIASDDLFSRCTVDIFRNYDKSTAINIAIRTMSPDIIVCDEIGSNEDSVAIFEAQRAGVPVIATAHASDVLKLISRHNIKELHKFGIFDSYVKIERNPCGHSLIFTYYPRDELDYI